jgi:hypothetical protein
MLVVGDCSGEACAVPPGSLPYGAAPAGNAVMLAAFVALLLPVLYAGLRYKTYLHSALLLAALLVEVGGHVGRIFLTANPASDASSAVYLIGTHWGAVLVGSAVNLVLPHVMVVYGEEFQLVSDPVYLNIFYFVLDIFMLAFQSVGIGFASTASTATEVRTTDKQLALHCRPLTDRTEYLGCSGCGNPLGGSFHPSHQPSYLPGNISLLPIQARPSPIHPRREILAHLYNQAVQELYDL